MNKFQMDGKTVSYGRGGGIGLVTPKGSSQRSIHPNGRDASRFRDMEIKEKLYPYSS